MLSHVGRSGTGCSGDGRRGGTWHSRTPCRRAVSSAGGAAGRAPVVAAPESRRAVSRTPCCRGRSPRSGGARAGCLGRRPPRGVCSPPCLYPLDSRRGCRPPFRRHTRTVERQPAPIDLVGPRQVPEQDVMESSPYPEAGPAFEAPPAGRSAAAVHLQREIRPRRACPEHEQNPRERRALGHARSAAPLARPAFAGQQRLHERPEFVRHEWLHAP